MLAAGADAGAGAVLSGFTGALDSHAWLTPHPPIYRRPPSQPISSLPCKVTPFLLFHTFLPPPTLRTWLARHSTPTASAQSQFCSQDPIAPVGWTKRREEGIRGGGGGGCWCQRSIIILLPGYHCSCGVDRDKKGINGKGASVGANVLSLSYAQGPLAPVERSEMREEGGPSDGANLPLLSNFQGPIAPVDGHRVKGGINCKGTSVGANTLSLSDSQAPIVPVDGHRVKEGTRWHSVGCVTPRPQENMLSTTDFGPWPWAPTEWSSAAAMAWSNCD